MNDRPVVAAFFCMVLLCPLLQAQTPEQRADEIISHMSLAEKIDQLHGLFTKGREHEPGVHNRWVPGIERLGVPPLPMANGPAGIGPTDFVQPRATAFPAPLAIAASWDPEDAKEYGSAVADEVLALGRTMLEAPTVNICRVPVSGRTFEGYGEDPLLAGEIGVANIQGIQSRRVLANVKHFALNNQEKNRQFVDAEADERTMREIYFPAFEAAVKRAHVASLMCSYNKVNGLYACQNPHLLQDVLRSDWGFDGFVVSDFGAAHDGVKDALAGLDLEMPNGETYDKAFQEQVEAGAVPVAQIDALLRHRYATMIRFGLFAPLPAPHPIEEAAHAQIARRLAADGIVLLRNEHATLPLGAATTHRIAVLGPAADQLLEGGGAAFVLPLRTVNPLQGLRTRFPDAKISFVGGSGAGMIDPRDTIDGLALTPAQPGNEANGVTAEYFDNMNFQGPPKVVRTERIPEIRSEFGAPIAGMLPQFSLRWTGTLRVPATGVYTLGFEVWGKMRLFLDGKPVLELVKGPNELASRSVSLPLEKGHAYTLRADYVSSARGVARLFWELPEHVDPPSLAAAVSAARNADTAIVFVGTWAHEGFDATTLALPRSQNRLIEAVAEVNPHTVVVLQSGIPTLMPWVNRVSAILEAWFPGEEGGSAIADVLSGDVNPSAKLPLTFPVSDAQTPASTPEQYPGVNGTEIYTEKLEVGYRWQNAHSETPLFPFGFGLSYTRFHFSELRYELEPQGKVDVSAEIRNTGERAGADVVQLYIDYPSSAGEPPWQLRGFQRVELRRGEARRVHFRLDDRAFSIWSTQTNQWKVPQGHFVLAVGDSSRSLPLRRELPR